MLNWFNEQTQLEGMMPICGRCNVQMQVGLAIGPTLPDYFKHAFIDPAQGYIRAEEMFLEHVRKCPQCGHSQDILTQN